MQRTQKVKIRDLNAHIVCSLCAGYYIDATTITECLHTFCRSCIIKFLQTKRCCPQCASKVHETQPLSSLRADRVLQDIVYKLIPALHQEETRRIEEFEGLHKKSSKNAEIGATTTTTLHSPPSHHFHHDRPITFSLNHFLEAENSRKPSNTFALKRRLMRASERTIVVQIKNLILQHLTDLNKCDLNINDPDKCDLKKNYMNKPDLNKSDPNKNDPNKCDQCHSERSSVNDKNVAVSCKNVVCEKDEVGGDNNDNNNKKHNNLNDKSVSSSKSNTKEDGESRMVDETTKYGDENRSEKSCLPDKHPITTEHLNRSSTKRPISVELFDSSLRSVADIVTLRQLWLRRIPISEDPIQLHYRLV